tara:strand:- start:3190 stop:3723 length:534 start_codon:yes stop_codon:yes gene_type:complete
MDSSRKDFLKNRQCVWIGKQPNAKDIIEKIENITSDCLVVPPPGDFENDLDNLIKRGFLFDTTKYKIVNLNMDISECHKNSCKFWLKHIRKNHGNDEKPKIKLFICTGYAKHINSNVWRQHSWLIDTENKIILETIKNGELFYGMMLTNMESLSFCVSQKAISMMECATKWFSKFNK